MHCCFKYTVYNPDSIWFIKGGGQRTGEAKGTTVSFHMGTNPASGQQQSPLSPNRLRLLMNLMFSEDSLT